MGKYIMFVQSRPTEGKEADYHAWYDGEHVGDILSIPGVVSARRFNAMKTMLPGPDLPFAAIYELETDDPQAVLAAMAESGAKHPSPDALDSSAFGLWLYEQR